MSPKQYKLLLIAVITSLVLTAVVVSSQKAEFHIDEIYSHILSNSHNADKLGNSDLLWKRWVEKSDWDEFTTVQANEKFDFVTVYKNNTTDAHPPLYYWLLNTVCSFFPNTFSMWYGIFINIVFYILSLITIYLISRRLIYNKYLAMLPMILWGFSPIAFDTVVYIRMYSLLAYETLALSLITLKIYQEGLSKRLLFLSFIITFAGAMTQYYFIAIAFCITLSYCLYCLIKKNYKNMFAFGITELAAIVLLIVAYPAAITQITGSPTNNIGNEVASVFFTFSGWAGTIVKYCFMLVLTWGGGLLKSKYATLICILISVIVLAVLIFKGNIGKDKGQRENTVKLFAKENWCIYIILFIILLYIIFISKLSYTYVYARYLYHIVPLMLIAGVGIAEIICMKLRINKSIISVLILTFALVNGFGALAHTQNMSLLFNSKAEYNKTTYNTYQDIPVVLLCDRKTYVLTSNYTFLKNYSDVYITSADSINNMENILSTKDYSSGIILLIWSDREWGNGYNPNEILSDFMDSVSYFDSYTYLRDINHCDVYYLN